MLPDAMNVQEIVAEAQRLALAGDLPRAEALCHDLLRAHGEQADALYMLGMFQSHAGNVREAAALLERAVAADGQFELAHASLGAVRLTLGELDAAIESLQAAVALDPDFIEAHQTLADALSRAGRAREAVEAWRRVSKMRPEDGDVLNRLAAALYHIGQLSDAADVWAAAIGLLPHRGDLQTNYASALYRLGRTRDGLAAAERAAGLARDSADAHHAVFQGLTAQRRFEEALAAAERLIALKPHLARAHYDRGITLLRLGELDGCDDALQAATRLDPTSANFASTLLMVRNYLPGYPVDALYHEHVAWAKRFAHARAWQSPRSDDHRNDRNADRPLRVGFVSTDFRLHPVADFMRALFTHHNRQRYEFIAYSDVLVEDRITADFRALTHTFRPIFGRTHEDVAAQIRDDKIDILIDLVAHSTEHRLLVFAQRPAPVQFSYLGYCNTTGLPEIDYILGDAVTDPPAAHQPYAEALLHLPATFACYTPPTAAPPVNALPAIANGGAITFGSLHALPKLNEQVIALWSRVLHATPEARLLLFRDAMTDRPRQRLAEMFAQHGIDSARLDFRRDFPPGGELRSIYHDIDISLDAFPWSGHTTACESMWMGVPMVTLRGENHAGRMAASAITHAGQPQWVADDADAFVAIAAGLARDPDTLARVRATLREQMNASRLCDGPTFSREFEAMLRRVWRRWCDRGRS
jgi:predicted O-linked N-acetylglucosamine transferase (SPINDLY family)